MREAVREGCVRERSEEGLWRAIALLAAAICLGPGCNRVGYDRATRARAPERPSVVLVTIDTLRADHVGAYGASFARTPEIDALAAEGTRFETAIAVAPITLPSHTSLLTGLWPPHHGVRNNGTYRLGDSLPTLAERFHDAGYATGAAVGAVVLRRRYGLARGFDRYDDRMGARKAGETGYLERSATEVTDAALAWLASVGDRPFFLWVHYYDPHLEHRAPEAFVERLPGRPYDAEIAYVDQEIGRLRAALVSAGRDEGSLWAVTADHGESLGEHGELSHGMTLYDGALRVPFILRGPGVPAGRSVGGVVRGVDLAPTLLSLAGLPPLPGADGHDLLPWMAPGAGPSPYWAYSESLLPQLDFGWAPLHGIRTATELYVRAPRPELYALVEDPGEQHDLSGTPDAAPRMAELDGRVTRILAAHGQGQRLALDADERARLQALGYARPAGAVSMPGLDPKDGLRYQGLIQQGSRAFVEQRYADAETALRAFLEYAPRSARAHGLLASTLLNMGRAAEASTHADRAIALDPGTAHHYADRAEIRLALDDPDGARADFEHAAEIDSEDPWVQVGLMWIRTRDPRKPGALAEAAQHARRAFSLAPNDAFVRFRVGMIWLGVGAYHAARDSFQDAVRLRPDFALAQARLAIEYARIGQLAEARLHRAEAGEWLRDPAVGSELAWALAAAGDRATARDQLAVLERLHPGDAHVARARNQIAALPPQPREGT